MSEAAIHVRIHDRPGALERVSGLLRRRGFAITRFSASQSDGSLIDLVIRIDESKTDRRRVQRELATLYDISGIRVGNSRELDTRELLRARLRRESTTDAPETMEFIGTPAQVDDMLAFLRSNGTLAGYTRSGEIALPAIDNHPPAEGMP
ncbi:MAG TPA: ACT domain-containing protein [Longimicrobiales bacterium]|nr:ACT domain-containing protein [Longimicrobiales bacterium]